MATKTSEGTREQLLRAAMICLRDKGYGQTTARDLVAVSGANLSSIGYHFGSKEALLNEAVAEGMSAWTAEVERAAFAEDGGGAEERLKRSLAEMIDRFDELAPYLVSFVEAFPPAARNDALRQRLAAAYAEARSAGAAMIERLLEQEGQEFDPGMPEVLSSLVLAVCDGLILQWLLDSGQVPTSDEVVNALTALKANQR